MDSFSTLNFNDILLVLLQQVLKYLKFLLVLPDDDLEWSHLHTLHNILDVLHDVALDALHVPDAALQGLPNDQRVRILLKLLDVDTIILNIPHDGFQHALYDRVPITLLHLNRCDQTLTLLHQVIQFQDEGLAAHLLECCILGDQTDTHQFLLIAPTRILLASQRFRRNVPYR